MSSFYRLIVATSLTLLLLGCRSTNQPQFADLSPSTGATNQPPDPVQPSLSPAPATVPTGGNSKIVIKGTKAGASQQDIAVALMAATRKLGPNKSAPDTKSELQMATQAADAILAGDKVVLEGASLETAESIAQDLRKAGLLVTTSK